MFPIIFYARCNGKIINLSTKKTHKSNGLFRFYKFYCGFYNNNNNWTRHNNEVVENK